ncbi:hypothetical protein ASPCAL00573 [Aspergillus calidoustus]|uniref:Myb-like domain-containing protein n=1 Tax=Aspergillus calidoustus TaxID=454130 RepID=A0A0U4YVR8_ASPCI|nr:hypothetical protein ASPCAL00573 [Aspergillus calidoustus]
MAIPGRADVPWTLEEKQKLLRLRFQHRMLSWPEFHRLNFFPGRSLSSIQGLWHRYGEPMILFKQRTNIDELEAALEAEANDSETEESQEEQPIHNTRSRKRTQERAGSDAENANVTRGRNKRLRVNPSKSPRTVGSSPTSVGPESQPHRPAHGIPEDYTFVMQIGPNAIVPASRTTRSSARHTVPQTLAPVLPPNAAASNLLAQNERHLEISDAGPIAPVANQQMSAYGPQHGYPAYSSTNVENWLSNTGLADAIHEYPDPEQNILSYILPETRDLPAFAHTQPDFEPQSEETTQATAQTTEPEHHTDLMPEADGGREQIVPEAEVNSIGATLHRIHNQQAIEFHRLQVQIGELIQQASVARRLSNRAGEMLATLQQPGGLFDLNFSEMEALVKAADEKENNPGRSN